MSRLAGCDLHVGPSQETVERVRAAGGRSTDGWTDAIAPVDLVTEEGDRRWVDEAAELGGGVAR